jgi:hydroxymethylpyrimidine/phosphomethylpyrimidine kinase
MSIQEQPIALTIAGFDPSGGAGVLRDAQTFVALGCRAAAVITSITFQNSQKVFGAIHQSGNAVRDQVLPLLNELPKAVKTGMLPTREVVTEVARLFRETELPAPIVDPVMISSSGHRLMEQDAVDALISEMLPLARLVTPNIPEAERITALRIDSEDSMRDAAAAIRRMGARAVLVKGGHLRNGDAVDVLDDDGLVVTFRGERVPNVEVHGTGCMLSAAIVAGLATGRTLEDSVRIAKQFVFDAIRNGVL